MKKYPNWDKFLNTPLYSLLIFDNTDIVIKLKKHIYFIGNAYKEDYDVNSPYDIIDFEIYDKLSKSDKKVYYDMVNIRPYRFKNVNLPKFNKKLPIYFVKVRELTDKRKYNYYYSLAIMDENLKWALIKQLHTYDVVPSYVEPNQDVLSWIRTDIYLD
jgi:hypothetical protein